jgi:iron complex outermembrane receptor protein
MKKNIIMLFLVALSGTFTVGSSSAGANDKNIQQLEKIIVTAQKQEENVLEVPVSVSVFGEIEIEDRRIEDVGDIADFVPNLMMYNTGTAGINIPVTRGISSSVMESMTVATGLFVDGVPILNPNGFEQEILDVERIEVLRGPQGTLYGKGTEVGAINIITRKPGNAFTGKISAQGGSMLSSETDDDMLGALSFNISGPIQKDRLFFGFTGKFFQKDGFIINAGTGDDVNDKQYLVGRGTIEYKPTEKLDIAIVVSHLDRNDGGMDLSLGEKGRQDYMGYLAWLGIPDTIPVPQDRKINSDLDNQSDEETDFQSLKVSYDFSDGLSLTSVTTNWQYKREALLDWDFTPLVLWHSDQAFDFSHKSQELRLNLLTEHFKCLFGLYYGSLDNDVGYEVSSIFPGSAGLNKRNVSGDTYSAFTNLTYYLIPNVNLVAGLRYEKEKQEFEDHITNFTADDSWKSFTPKFAAEYKISPNVMTYIGVSSGRRPGGFNVRTRDPEHVKYDEEILWSYETGLKGVFLDSRLTLSGALFYMDIQDMQVNTAISQNETYLSNAGEATGKGGELELTFRLMDPLIVTAGVGYTNIEFDQFNDEQGNYNGNKNPYTPEYTFNAGFKYRRSNGFYLGADVVGYGKMYIDKANTYARDAYSIVNTKIGFEKGAFDFYVYGKNIFDETYNTEGYYEGTLTNYSEPGEMGVQVNYRF